MEREIESRVVALTKRNQDKLVEESGIQSSLTEEDMKDYLEQVIEEGQETKDSYVEDSELCYYS